VFREISNEILQNKEEAYIFPAVFIRMGNKTDIRDVFNTARDEEYKEFIDKCEDCQHEYRKGNEKGIFLELH